MANAKEIKGRIASIKNTQKTTKAMELVSGAKMRKAVQAATRSRAYKRAAWSIARNLRQNAADQVDQSLMRFFHSMPGEFEAGVGEITQAEPNGKTLVIVFTSNRGLCGAFNSSVVKKVAALKQISGSNHTVEIIGIGKKGVAMLNSIGVRATEAFEKDDSAQTDESIREVAAIAYDRFKSGEFHRVMIATTYFESPVVQTAHIQQLYPLPVHPESEEKAEEARAAGMHLTTFEPSPSAVLEFLIPRIAEVELYQALLESNASEHSARMIAMKNASDAAKEMGEDLKLAYNRARQAAITQEIAEIAAGSAAVS